MADAITIDLRTYAQLQGQTHFLRQFPLYNSIYPGHYHKGKDMQIYHFDMTIDTLSGGPTFVEIADPTNIVFNYAAPEQVYIRSDAAADQGLKIDVIGEKADGSFGQFTLTSNAVNGTTAVDVGTWNFIAFVIKNDAWAGNVIIDDDGISTTVYWTAALGATATSGILVVPTGYKAAFLNLKNHLLDVPSNLNAANVMDFGLSMRWLVNSYTSTYEAQQPIDAHVIVAGQRISLTGMFEGAAVTKASLHSRILLWEA